MWRIRFTIHPLLVTLLMPLWVWMTVWTSVNRTADIGGGHTAQLWYLAATFATASVCVALTAWSSWRLLAAVVPTRSPDRHAELVERSVPTARAARVAFFVVFLMGPGVSLIDVWRVDSWSPLLLGIYGAVVINIVNGIALSWQVWRIRSRLREIAAKRCAEGRPARASP